MIRWHNLFLLSERRAPIDDIADGLRYALAREKWEQYDPFGLVPGRTYARTLKLFISPDDDLNWRRVLVEATQTDDVAPIGRALSRFGPCLELALDEAQGTIAAYHNGMDAELTQWLSPWLTAEEWQVICDAPPAMPSLANAGTVGEIPLSALPPDVQRMAGQLSVGQGALLFDKMAGQLLPAEQQAAGRALLTARGPNWDSDDGRRIRALAHALGLPSTWREPDFVTVRVAYQLMTRQKRNPNARLLPGDEDYIKAVPLALSYVPIYGGKDV